jgi:Flp pilus assembly protein CpaB
MALEEAQLHEVLKQEAVAGQAKSDRFGHRFLFAVSCYWGELLVLIIIGILLSLLILNAVQRRDTLVVMAPNGLPAFHILEASDVYPRKMFIVHDSFTSANEVIGRYLLQPVSPGVVLLKSQLAPPGLREHLKGRQVMTVPLKSGAISSTIAPAGRIRLLFSPRNTLPSLTPTIANLIIDDVIVLSVSRQGDSSSITVALKNEEDLARALEVFATSDVLISE